MKKPNHSKDLRTFLGAGQPPLQSAVELLGKQFRHGITLDLSPALIVLPTMRAVQRLIQLFIQLADQESLRFTPPQIITIGEFPERLYPIHQKFATDLCQQLAWAKALQESNEQQIEDLFPGTLGNSHDAWQPYAKLISDLHKRLGNDVWSFSSVVREVQTLDNFSDRELKRWQSLQAIQKRYYKILGDAQLWDKQAARNVAVKRELCRTDKQIIMIGTADLNRSTKLMLDQIRQQVQILVAAPRNLAARFDEFGGIITEQWLHTPIEFSSECIRIVDSAEDQSFAVAHFINSLGDEFSADQITVGIPDPEIQPQIERSLNAIGLKHRDLKGQQVKHTPPVRLMTTMLEFLKQQNFTTFSALIRHPDMFQWISNQVKKNHWLSLFDAYQQNGLPDRVELGAKLPFGAPDKILDRATSPERGQKAADNAKLLNQIHEHISRLFTDVTGPNRPIAQWTGPWCKILAEIYGDRILDKNKFEDQQTIVSCRELYKALLDKKEVPTSWDIRDSAAKAMQMAIDAASDRSVIPPAIPDAIELSGWLDLPLDDAQVIIVTGMNDEHVPASENGHLFLPNRLCTALGILDNDRRYARDAYALTLIKGVHSRKLLMIAGRKDLQGEPKKPSRLLFADNNQILAERAGAFFSFEGKADSRFWLANPAHAPITQQFPIPRPANYQPLSQLSVTSFKEFLRCPYRFYLGKILRLEKATDNWAEMDARAFGNLAHEVLEAFGLSDCCNSASEKQIIEFLDAELDQNADQLYAGSRLPAVRIQIEQLRLRLHKFAGLQAQRAAAGWRIISAEEKVVHPLEVDGQPFSIVGTIDRVDVHETNQQVEIWDYKTSDRGDDPTTMHLNKAGWKDLQLPLYRHLVKQIQSVQAHDLNNINLGYVQLPKQIDRVRFSVLECTQDQLAAADRLIESIIRRIRGGEFWPPQAKPPEYSQDFAGICQDNAFEKFDVNSVETPA